MENVRAWVDGPVGYVSVDRYEEARNAMDTQTKEEFIKQLQAYEDNDDVRVVVICAEGEGIFCAGGDLKEGEETDHDVAKLGGDWEILFMAIQNLDMPTIAEVDGPAIAGGMDLLLYTDLVIASERAEFRIPELDMGFVDWFSGSRLAKIVGIRKAFEIVLTGNTIDAHEAERIGLVNRVVASEELSSFVSEMARAIGEKNPRTVAKMKDAFYRSADLSSAHFEVKALSLGEMRSDPDFPEGASKHVESSLDE